MTRYPPLIVLALSLAACQASLPPAPVAATGTSIYACDDSRTVQATYPDTDTAVLVFDQQAHRLHTAISASGARYVGDGWQWWTKGMQQASLAPLQPGESYASAAGVACQAP